MNLWYGSRSFVILFDSERNIIYIVEVKHDYYL